MIAVLALAAGISSCSKSDSSDPSNPNNNNNNNHPVSYRIDGLTDVSVQGDADSNTSVTTLMISDTLKSQQKITLSLEGLPNGCTGDFSVNGGYPSYTSVLTIKDNDAAPGVYPVKLNGEGSISGKTSLSFNLTIRPRTNFALYFLGTGNATVGLSGEFPPYTDHITKGDTLNRIVFNNYAGQGVAVYGDITGDVKHTMADINIPVQTIGGRKFWGSGNVWSSAMTNSGSQIIFSYKYTRAAGDTVGGYVTMDITQ
ncbi:hypothetical protein DN068_11525 [Taibaiella soli]|uniref:Uncharacterized protein n=2 Tax=Taibaiella soli TaxID=1649169 RepID=A0A2W2AXT3_9BACT|nr:hypothetical protein DN068_11525 [Taibaiella soli]